MPGLSLFEFISVTLLIDVEMGGKNPCGAYTVVVLFTSAVVIAALDATSVASKILVTPGLSMDPAPALPNTS